MINSILSKIKNHFVKSKYLYLLTFLCLLQIFLAGHADLTNYDPNHDVISYRKIAIAFPSIDYSVGKPFAHRFLAPWLVGLFFNDVDLGFTLFNALFSVIFIFTLFYFLKQNRITERIAFFITAAFIFNRYFIPNFAYEPYRLVDVLSNLFLLIALISLESRKYTIAFIISLVGVFAKESALLIVPVGMAYIFGNDKRNKLLMFTLFSILLFAAFIAIRKFIPMEHGISFTQAFLENWTKIFSPEVITKQFFLAFNPFFLIPIFCYKEFIDFSKKNFHWSVLLFFVIISSLFGGDKERLMFPYILIYYLFIALMFQRLEDKKQIKIYILISVLFLSWIANLHHIWGLIKLPSREISFTFALLGGIIMPLIYLKLKGERKVIYK